jgi:glycosyltransferase involved in cell wall biosynthesis
MDNQKQISIDNQIYRVEIFRNVQLGADATRIIIPTLILNNMAKNLLRVCVESIQKFTIEEVEIWIVDNNSSESYTNWLKQFSHNINLALNRTEPINPFRKERSLIQKVRRTISGQRNQKPRGQMEDGSYANFIGLELGRRCIDPDSATIFTMHYDTLATKLGWLKYLKSKLTDKVRAVGYRQNKLRVDALHVAGLLLDYSLFEPLHLSFMPNMRRERFPNKPEYDVGDQITIQLKAHGFDFKATRNTFNNPEFGERAPKGSPFRQMLACDLCFDDDS